MSVEGMGAGLPLPDGLLDPGTTFEARIGVTPVGRDDDGTVHATLAVREALLDARGVVPNGVYAAVAESLASVATAIDVMQQGLHAQGLSNDTSMLEDVREGTIAFTARPVGRGGTAWAWVVEGRREADGAVCALSRVVIATRAPG
jgi:1,4-dihydroxy-2-naphthoyl-CoA hydrolase